MDELPQLNGDRAFTRILVQYAMNTSYLSKYIISFGLLVLEWLFLVIPALENAT